MNQTKFLERVTVTPGCWIWTGATNSWGRGNIRVSGKVRRAYQVAYELFKGPIPPGAVLRHTCDNPLCVNPDHLEAGTQLDNVRDTQARGRSRGGSRKNQIPDETRDQIIGLRRQGVSFPELSRRFGYGTRTIYEITRGVRSAYLRGLLIQKNRADAVSGVSE